MAKLSAKARKALPASSFGLPGTRGFPMEDKTHAKLAKSGASRALNVGNITPAEKTQIDRKADAKLSDHASAVKKINKHGHGYY